jgi:cytochrome c oxidase cbb3-type subunit 3
VVDYIRNTLMSAKPANAHYHTAANGWPDHGRFADAFPFATGETSLEIPWEDLDARQRAGKRLYLSACITCHDNRNANQTTPIWEIKAMSYPRKHYSHREQPPDALSGASVHQLHEHPVVDTGLSEQGQLGRQLYLQNCAFCHAPDGSARNWIGSFLEPRPRDFTANGFIAGMSQQQLEQVINKGIPGTSMPAWKNVLTAEQVSAIAVFLKSTFE